MKETGHVKFIGQITKDPTDRAYHGCGMAAIDHPYPYLWNALSLL